MVRVVGRYDAANPGRRGLCVGRFGGVALVGGDAADIVGILLSEVGVEVGNAPPHFVSMFLIDAKDDGLGKAVGLLEKPGQVAGDGFRPGAQRDRLLKILGLVFIVGDGAPVAVQFIAARSPA